MFDYTLIFRTVANKILPRKTAESDNILQSSVQLQQMNNEKLQHSIQSLGKKWLLHPSNRVKRLKTQKNTLDKLR